MTKGSLMTRMTASGRSLRRLRASFRQELLGDSKPTPSDDILIDLAAQAALRVREMRDEITAGNRVADEDLVRISNTVNRIMRELKAAPPPRLMTTLSSRLKRRRKPKRNFPKRK
jgi:hypothetical protein